MRQVKKKSCRTQRIEIRNKESNTTQTSYQGPWMELTTEDQVQWVSDKDWQMEGQVSGVRVRLRLLRSGTEGETKVILGLTGNKECWEESKERQSSMALYLYCWRRITSCPSCFFFLWRTLLFFLLSLIFCFSFYCGNDGVFLFFFVCLFI